MEIITKPLKDLDIAHYNPRKNLGPNDPEYQKLKSPSRSSGWSTRWYALPEKINAWIAAQEWKEEAPVDEAEAKT